MSEWKKLSDLVERKICYGIVQPGNKVGNVPIIKVNNIIAGLNTVENLETTTEEIASKYERTKLKGGELIISLVGTVGVTAIVPHSFAGCNLVRATGMIDIVDDVLAKYVKYYLETKSAKEFLYGRLNTTVQPTLNVKTLENLPIPIIDRHKIIAITSILSSLDDKIAVNRRICENLEAQAQALFKHWFIDFAPFKNGQFVESELGMIPEGLIYKRIGEMPHTLETGKRPSGGVKGIESGVPSIGAENIKGLGCYDYSKTKFVTEEYAASMKKGKINGYELLIYKDGGKPGYFIPNFAIFGEGYPYDEMCLNEHVFKLDFGNRGYSLFAYFFFKTKQIMSYLNAQGAKAAIPGINSKDIDAILMPSLENKWVKDYCNEVEDVITHILMLSKESARLSTLRDALLPKLMSGQIKV